MKLALTAITALADEPVHVVATLLAGLPDEVESPPNATVCGFVSHAMVLGPRNMRGDARRNGCDPLKKTKGTRPWRAGVRGAVRS